MSPFRRLFGIPEPSNDIRIIITRHGERADLTLGKQWLKAVKEKGGRDPRVSYLARRNNFNEWAFDSPITVNGERQSASVGRKLAAMGYYIDYCYSSPAYRSIQTANKILDSQGRKGVPINIEPGLFECPAWYQDKPLSFIPPEYLAQDGTYNIDPAYSPMYPGVDSYEDEKQYYKRSRQFINEILRRHKYTGGTILLSGHGGSIEAVTRGLRGFVRRHNRSPEFLIQEAMRVNYCSFAILERDPRSGEWIINRGDSHNNLVAVPLSRQSIIPLYSVSSQVMTKTTALAKPPAPKPSHGRRHTHQHQHQHHPQHQHQRQRQYQHQVRS